MKCRLLRISACFAESDLLALYCFVNTTSSYFSRFWGTRVAPALNSRGSCSNADDCKEKVYSQEGDEEEVHRSQDGGQEAGSQDREEEGQKNKAESRKAESSQK